MSLWKNLVLTLVVLANGTLIQYADAQDDGSVSSMEKIKELLTERRDTLRARADAVESRYLAGNISFDQLIAARIDLCDAELELVNDTPNRIAVLEKKLKSLRDLEQATAKGVAAGQTDIADQLLAKSERIRIEVEVLREKSRMMDGS